MPNHADLSTKPSPQPPPRVLEGGVAAVATRFGAALGLSIFFFILYGFCNDYTATRSDVGTLYFEFERNIPLIPWLIVPYMSLDLFFFFTPFLCDRQQLKNLGMRILTAITIACACFLLFPLRFGFDRPEVTGIFAPWFQLLWSLDRPYNMAPSLHLALRTIIWPVYIRRLTGAPRTACKVWFVLIGVSTLFTYQHHLIDVISGQFLGIACLYYIPDAHRTPSARQQNLRIARRYAAGALACVGVVFLAWPWGVLMLWPAAALAIVTAGYLGAGGGIFRKSGGRIPNNARWMLGPYLGAAWIVHRIQRRSRTPVEIEPGNWFGPRLTQGEATPFLQRQGINAVLDLTAEFSEPPAFRDNPAIAYLNIPMLDLAEPTRQQLEAAQQFIEAHQNHGVYVHCALGRFRCGEIVRLLNAPSEENDTADAPALAI